MSAIGWLSEKCKIDAALMYQAVAAAPGGIVGRYFRLSEYRKLVFAFVLDTLATGEAVVAWVVQANTAAGGGAANIATATCIVTANTHATRLTVTLAAVNVADTLTITVNAIAVQFVAGAAADLPNHVFDQSGADAADAASLILAINHAAAQAHWAVGGATVTAVTGGGAVVVLEITDAGTGDLTAVAVGGTMTVATVQAVGFIEVDATALLVNTGFEWAALRLTGPATVNAAAVAIRAEPRYGAVVQHVGASDTDS